MSEKNDIDKNELISDNQEVVNISNEISNHVISDIVSNEYMKMFLDTMVSEFDMNKNEAMEMYYIFKDMITNSGDFDSSGAVRNKLEFY